MKKPKLKNKLKKKKESKFQLSQTIGKNDNIFTFTTLMHLVKETILITSHTF